MAGSGGDEEELEEGADSEEGKGKALTIQDIRERLMKARQEKIRYGRATLTINRWGALMGTPIHEVLIRYDKDEASAEDVACAFARERIEGHSPSFDWDSAELERLIPLITGIASEPEMSADSGGALGGAQGNGRP